MIKYFFIWYGAYSGFRRLITFEQIKQSKNKISCKYYDINRNYSSIIMTFMLKRKNRLLNSFDNKTLYYYTRSLF